MKTMTATKALNKVREQAERIKNDETAAIGTVSVGDVVRQGDLYLVCISGSEPTGLTPSKERQLAPGNTQGSRHVAAGKCKLFTPADTAVRTEIIVTLNRLVPTTKDRLVPNRDEALIGPVLKTLAPVEIEHPEHGNRILPAGETFCVVYQRAFAEETRRQED